VEFRRGKKWDMKVKGTLLRMWKGKERRGNKRIIKGMNIVKAHCIHVWKYHNEAHYSI
jgi:hypothetical protein